MDEEIERLVVSVRADTRAFAQDVGSMRAVLDGPLADGLEQAGRRLDQGLSRAIQRGKFGFEDLRNIALSALSDIASAAIRSGLNSLFSAEGGSSGGSGGLLGSLTSAVGSLFGAPGRATGGPVSPGQAYRVGERGPEIFVPTSSGRIETGLGRSGGMAVNMTINISDNGNASAPETMRRSSRQIARSVRRVLEQADY
jgi:hypothetical protein